MLLSPRLLLRDTSYPVGLFGASSISCVFTGNEDNIHGRRGETVSIKLKLIYVWRADGHDSPKKVIVRMQPGIYLHPNSKAVRLHLPIDELRKKLRDYERTGIDPERLFFDSAKFVSFEPQEIELYDRQIDEVTMKVAIPSDLPDSIGKGKGKRSLMVLPIPKVITPSKVGSAYGGINIQIRN